MSTSTLQTNTDFISIDPNVTDADTLDDFVGGALCYQYMFERRTTPWEMTEWDYDELQSFKVDLEEINRVYHVYFRDFHDDGDGQEYRLIGRVEHKGQPLYLELVASCDYTGFDCQGGGVIFVSRDANLFMKLVLTSDCKKDLIYQSLGEDGIEAEVQTEYDTCRRIFWINPPMLKYLCYQATYKHRVQLQPQLSSLPKCLVNSIEEFINFHEAKKAYDEL